jgi:hypothetical protein
MAIFAKRFPCDRPGELPPCWSESHDADRQADLAGANLPTEILRGKISDGGDYSISTSRLKVVVAEGTGLRFNVLFWIPLGLQGTSDRRDM